MLFFPKKRGLAPKSAVSLLFCPFLRFFGPKKAPFPRFRILYPCFFRQNFAFLSPQFQKNPRAHKNKIGTPPTPKTPPPQKRGILRTWFFLQKERIFPGVHKIGAPISGPRIADTNFTDTRIFLKIAFVTTKKAWVEWTPKKHRKRKKHRGGSGLDDPIRANRFDNSRESPDSRESLEGSRAEPPFFANRASGGGGGTKCESQF